jgi:hypothetical protein
MRRELEGQAGLEDLLRRGELLHGAENTEEGREALQELAEKFLKIRNRNGAMAMGLQVRAELVSKGKKRAHGA